MTHPVYPRMIVSSLPLSGEEIFFTFVTALASSLCSRTAVIRP